MSVPEIDNPFLDEIVRYTVDQFGNVFRKLLEKYDLPNHLVFASSCDIYPFVIFGNFSFVINDEILTISNIHLKLIQDGENSVLNAFNLILQNFSTVPLICDRPFLNKLLINDSVVSWYKDNDYHLIGSEKGALSVLCPSD